MRVVAFDTETHLIKPGLVAPRMVCLSFAEYLPLGASVEPKQRPEAIDEQPEPWIIPKREPPTVRPVLHAGLRTRTKGLLELRSWLLDPDVLIVGHNLWFDLGVCICEWPDLLPLVFAKLEAGLAVDTMVRQQLIDIAQGELKFHLDEDGEVTKSSYHLSDLSYRLLHRWLKKEDTWRLKYALLDGVPLTDWAPEAKDYALLDAIVTLDIFHEQELIAGGPITNSVEQHRAAFALYLMGAWGVRTDVEAVATLRASLTEEFNAQMSALRPSGLLRISPARTKRTGERVPEQVTKNMAAIKERVDHAFTKLGLLVPRTAGNDIATDRKTLLTTLDPDLKLLAESGATAKLLKTYVPVLERGVTTPINARWNVLLETGRTSCSGPNLQNLPRK